MAMRGVTIAWHLSRRHHASELSARAWSAPLGIRGYATGDEKVESHRTKATPQRAWVPATGITSAGRLTAAASGLVHELASVRSGASKAATAVCSANRDCVGCRGHRWRARRIRCSHQGSADGLQNDLHRGARLPRRLLSQRRLHSIQGMQLHSGLHWQERLPEELTLKMLVAVAMYFKRNRQA